MEVSTELLTLQQMTVRELKDQQEPPVKSFDDLTLREPRGLRKVHFPFGDGGVGYPLSRPQLPFVIFKPAHAR